MTRARDLSKLLGTNTNGVIPNSNLGVSFTNISDTGTEGTKVALGTTAQRGSTAGQIRFNSDSNALEFYDGTTHKYLGQNLPPIFTTASGSLGTLNDSNKSSSNLTQIQVTEPENQSITFSVTSGSLPSGITLNSNGTWSGTANAVSTDTTFNFTVTVSDNLNNVNRNFSITVNAPIITFTTASGSIGNIYDSSRSSYSLSSVTATASSGTITNYSLSVGSLPTGLSLNSTTGAITGTASAVGADTTSTFTIQATLVSGTATVTNTRQFSITVNAPVVLTFAYTGAVQNFDTTTIKNFRAYVWGAGSNSCCQTAVGGFSYADLTVDSGTNTLYLIIGLTSQGNAGQQSFTNGAGGASGGGGTCFSGAGFSGIFTTASDSSLSNTVIIAGGAGGDGSGNNTAPTNGGNSDTSPNNCCGTGGAGSGSNYYGGNGGGGGNSGGGGGGGYYGGGGGGGACCSGIGGKGGSNYTGGNSSVTTTNTYSEASNGTSNAYWSNNAGATGNNGLIKIVY